MKLNKYLYDARTKANKTQREYAEEIGISYVTYNKLEVKRKYSVGIRTINKLADFFGVQASEIREMI